MRGKQAQLAWLMHALRAVLRCTGISIEALQAQWPNRLPDAALPTTC